MYYLLKQEGFKIIYLGTNIPNENLLSMLLHKKPDRLFTYLPPGSNSNITGLLANINQISPGKKINIVSGDTSLLAFEKNKENMNYIPYNQLFEMVQIA